jgi:hypothetical protein
MNFPMTGWMVIVNYFPVKETLITIISDLPVVLTGGPHKRIPLVTKKWVFPIFLYPQLNSYTLLVMRFIGKSCPLCVCPDRWISVFVLLICRISVGRWSTTIRGSESESELDFIKLLIDLRVLKWLSYLPPSLKELSMDMIVSHSTFNPALSKKLPLS